MRERLERLRQRQLEDARDWPSVAPVGDENEPNEEDKEKI